MTTKQVETSITINTTARSIFICTTMNSYVQYFQRYIPFAFTIEGSRHPLPHPTPLSYLFHFLSFFFFFHYVKKSLPSHPTPLSSIFFHYTRQAPPSHPTPFSYIFFHYTNLSYPPHPTLLSSISFHYTNLSYPPHPTPLSSTLSLTIRNSNSLPTLSPAFIYYDFIYYLWL